VIVARDLAAEDRARLPHPGLEEGVPYTAQVGLAAGGRDGVGDRATRSGVVEDGRPGILDEGGARQQGADEVAVAEGPAAVDEEAAIGVAVPGDRQIEAALLDLVDEHAPILLEEGVRPSLGEIAVGLPATRRELEVELLQQRADHRAGHAVAAV